MPITINDPDTECNTADRNISLTFDAVSYKHLDVYKRQGISVAFKGRDGNFIFEHVCGVRCKQYGYHIASGIDRHGVNTVSYTHLFARIACGRRKADQPRRGLQGDHTKGAPLPDIDTGGDRVRF